MRYYAIADLHGRFDLLEKALKQIAEDIRADGLTGGDYNIITLGDYIDRGPQSKEIIDRLIKLQDFDVISLKGNHEAMAVESITSLPDISWWVRNGGDSTLKSYNHGDFTFGTHYEILLQQGVVPDEHVKWMASLPHFYETEKHVFVHAGVLHNKTSLEEQSKLLGNSGELRMLWMLYLNNDAGGFRGKHVVHGHHQFEDGPHEWSCKNGGRTNLDTFAWKTGRLVVGVFNDTQGKAVKYLEVLGDDYEGKRDSS